jgi:hypothetical protein
MRILQSLLRTKYSSIINNYFASNANKIYKTNKNKYKKASLIIKRNYSNFNSNQNIEPPNNHNMPTGLFIILISVYTFWQSRKPPPAEQMPIVPWLINLHAH